MEKIQRKNDNGNKFCNALFIILSCMIYLPLTSSGNVIRIVVMLLCIMACLVNSKGVVRASNLKLLVYMLLSPFISFFFVFLFEHTVNQPLVMHEIIRMFFCAGVVFVCAQLSVSFKAVYVSTLIALIPNFVIQLLQFFKVEIVFTFIKNNYIDQSDVTNKWTHLELARATGLDFRSGSIFLNPNVYMIIPLLALCVFLVMERKKPSVVNMILIIISIVSCFLTGSRTSIIIVAILLLVYLIKYASKNRLILWCIILTVVIVTLGSFLVNNSRAVQIFQFGSFSYKLESYLNYFKITLSNPIYWITGSLGTSFAWNMDSEWGFIFTWYGILGLHWYIMYYKEILNTNRKNHLYATGIVIAMAFTSITASVLLCMPVFPFAGSIAFTRIEDNSLETLT